MFVKKNIKTYIPSIIGLTLVVVSFGVMSGVLSSRTNNLSQLESNKIQLQNKIDQMSVQNKTLVTKVKSQATGLKSDKVEADNKAVNDLMTYVFNWKSYDEYTKIREDLMTKYYLKSDSSFMTVFMPELFNEEIDGKKYNRIDVNGYNIKYNNIKTYVTSSDSSDVYSYFSVVSVTTQSKNEGSKDFSLVNAIIITAFLWMLRLVFVPSLLFMVTSWFAVNMTPTLAIEVYKVSGLSKDSPLTDQFAFFYLPMVAYLFIFGIVIVVLLCYTEYRFWKKCGLWIKYWYAKTNIKNPFKMLKN